MVSTAHADLTRINRTEDKREFMSHAAKEFVPLHIAVLTVSDTRTLEQDSSGQLLVDRLSEAGHVLADRALIPDDIYRLRAEVSRWIAGTSTVQSRAVAGLANRTLVFCMPGSTNACRTAWDRILGEQLDARTRPCNFIPHVARVAECEGRS